MAGSNYSGPVDETAWQYIPSRLGGAPVQLDATGQPIVVPPQVVVQRFPPWLYPIPGAQAFIAQVENVVVAAGATVSPADLIVNVGNGSGGVVRFGTLFVLSPTTDLDVTFILKANNAPVSGWSKLRAFPQTAGSLERTFDGFVRVGPNTKLSVDIVNNSATPWTVGFTYAGWTWNVAEAQQYAGGAG